MAFSYACLTLQRVVVPAVLVLAALIRPVGISFVYLLMFFMSPFVPLATRRNFRGSVTAYFIILLAIVSIVLLCHIGVQVSIEGITLPITGCKEPLTVLLLRHVGFINFQGLQARAIIEWLAPEVLVFATSVGVYLSIKKLAAQNTPAEQLENGTVVDAQQQVEEASSGNNAAIAANAASNGSDVLSLSRKRVSMISQHIHFDGLIKISPLFCLATLFFAAVLRPSVPGGFYFLIFLLAGTYWAMFQTLQRGFALLLRFIMVVIVLHSLAIVSFQTPWMQDHVNASSLAGRLIGLEPLILSACNPDIRILQYNTNYKLDSFLNPIALLFAYFALALTTKHLIKPRTDAKPATAFGQPVESNSSSHHANKINRQLSLLATQSSSTATSNTAARHGGSRKDNVTRAHRLSVSLRREQRSTLTEPTETTPLVRQSRKSRTTQAVDSPAAPTTSRGNDIQLDSMEQRSETENNTASLFEQISYGFVSVGGFIYQNSYIFTNILMMAWSIVYHSWLTFILLLWANVLWMIPNQRKAMMRSSPFIVLYAEVLLIAQYIYGMDLTDDELPTKVSTAGINLHQIGFERPSRPCVPLIVKTSFVLMFWVTSRQFFKEKSEKRRDSTLADIIAPLQITVGSAGSTYLINDGKKTSKFLKKAGDVIKNLLVRLWIWLLVLVIFLCAITGRNMTGFRICYMALFLFFLLVFQSSSKAWVKIMYGFWLFLIFYAMSILILIYTYQFDKFDNYWERYLNISKSLQGDIGLKKYETKELFLHLVSPTIIVILTVIQVHYFHKRFIDSLQQQPLQKPVAPPTIEDASITAAAATSTHASTKRRGSGGSLRRSLGPNDVTDFETSVRELVRISFRKIKNKSKFIFKNFKDIFWRLLELHIMKAVYLTAFICSVSEVCLFHVIFVGLVVLGVISQKSVQVFISRLISFIVTIIVLSKMIYQITYLKPNWHEMTCNFNNTNVTVNNAVWFGLRKASDATGGLMGLLRPYIIYMVVVTLHAVITLRQLQMRIKTDTRNVPIPKVLFPNIERADAEKDLIGLTKYLFNYGFYKFGIEISLIALVSTITYRQDIVAVAYAVWLFLLLLLNRSKCAKVWGILQTFFAISILIQYVVLVGLPPGLCLQYPWIGKPYGDSLQRWALLPGNLNYNHVPKMIFDFIVLIILNRQKRVFSIEFRYATNDDYPGGSNLSVVSDIANLGRIPFDNPTHDFCSFIRNYSDILKNAVLCGFYWITLAVVFLAGTNIADLLALGYLIGAFIFLWQGSDFYLSPINTIISRWNLLLTYNVANILIKTCLQMAGCLFMTQLRRNCCWLVHMLGITCASDLPVEIVPEELSNLKIDECPQIAHQIVLLWDTICFAFIIFQLRIFKSHYFCHIIIDTKANNILASRGADIIENLRQKQIANRHEHEKQVLHKIKRKMERIRATQQKLLRPMDKQLHFDGASTPTDIVEPIQPAPLAQNSSFVSCQGSGYRTPDEDEEERSYTTSTSDSADQAVIIEQEINIIPCDDQTDYADVNSLSESSEHDTKHLHLPLDRPTAGIYTPQQVSGIGQKKQNFDKSSRHLDAKPTTPSSDMQTLPIEGFLDTGRISLSSMPHSDLIVKVPLPEDDTDECFEVFSPPPYDTAIRQQQQQRTVGDRLMPPTSAYHTLPHTGRGSLSINVSGGSSVISSNITPNLRRHRRQSSTTAAVSWHDTVSIKHSPKKSTSSAVPIEEQITEEVTLRKKSLHRRHLSMGNASYSMDEAHVRARENRGSSNISGARDEAYLRSSKRPHSWGPVEHGYPLPATRVQRRKEIKLHPHATRAGDYYMFDELDDKIELDLIHDEVDFEDENITESEMKMQRRKTLYDVWKDLNNAEYRRYLYMRERSYASAPGSRIGLKIDEIGIEDDDDDTLECDVDMMGGGGGGSGGAGVRTSTLSEPLDYASRLPIATSEPLVSASINAADQSFKSKDAPIEYPSTSKGISKEKDVASLKETSAKTAGDEKEPTSKETSDSKSKVEVDSGEVTAKDSDEDFDTNPIIRLLEGFLVTLTIRLNRFSRNYRFVNRILAEEKKTLKEPSTLNRLGLSSAAAMFHFLKSNLESDDEPSSSNLRTTLEQHEPTHPDEATTTTHNNLTTTTTMSPITPNTPQPPPLPLEPPTTTSTPHADADQIIEMPTDTVDASSTSRKQSISASPTNKGRKCESSLPEIRIKAPSIERNSHTHLTGSGSLSKHWSYEQVDSAGDFNLEEENFVLRDHHIIIEVLISAWYALLANTDLICYIVVFINQVVNASLISLPLPIMVFLWGTLSLPRPTKTFWVTLIAYTQSIVLIKCIFQFKLIWVNYSTLANNPLATPKIFGVEMKTHYAVYDLILLLVLFLHRYLLKSQGLWKSGYKERTDSVHKKTASIDERDDSDNLSNTPEARDGPEHDESMQKLSTHVSQASLPNTPLYSKGINQLERTKYMSSLRKFFFSLVHKSRLPTDVYALMFLCDFVNFFVLLFGFTAFGTQQSESDGGVQTYLAENKVPIPFLIMLLVQFLLIVIDRSLYLRKALKNKIFFHFLSVIGIHIWMFFIVPLVTERSFNSLAPPIIFYIIKCFYMLLSSYQIKSGYPKRILGNFFTKGFSLVNMISFKVYMQIPFLYELRTILDWVCIDSTMTLFDWLKMEDIFSNIYLIRCTRQSETDFPAMRAQKKAASIKLLMGGTVVLLIVICIWGPLCLFALGNAVGQSNVPFQVQYNIRVGPYDPIYTTNNYDSVHTFTDTNYAHMQDAYVKNQNKVYNQSRQAHTFLTGYDASDVAAVKLAGNAPSLWRISPPDLERLISDLENGNPLTARFSYSLTRLAPAKGLKDSVSHEIITSINGTAEQLNSLTEILSSKTETNATFKLPAMIPKFVKVLNSGDILPVNVLGYKDSVYRPLVIKMHRDNETNSMWWELRDYCEDEFYEAILSKLPYSDCKSGIVMYTFNDKKFPSTFSFLTAGGIIGLYTTFVLLASRFMKSFIGGQNRKIMYEDLPYVDRVLQLCLDIYLVREALEFALEEDLFAKLLFLYRSPETMIKWTRPKEEYVDDDGDTDSLPSRMSVRRPEQQQQQLQQQQLQQQQQQQ